MMMIKKGENMANICSNSLVFFSTDKDAITKFKKFIEESDGTLDGMGEKLGLNTNDYEKWNEWVEENNDLVSKSNRVIPVHSFIIKTHSKWTPCTEAWEEILTEYHKKNNLSEKLIDYFFVSEEPGEGIYVNTDTHGIFFTDRVKIEISYKGNWLDGIYLCSYDNEEVIEEIIDACSEVNIPEEIVNKALENALTGEGIDIICEYIKENGDYEIYVHFYDEDYYV